MNINLGQTIQKLKRAALAAVLLLCCLFAGGQNLHAARSLPDYVVLPAEQHDSYILTQLFYSAFNANELELVQQLVQQGMLAAPQEFPQFMALVLELLKAPDSRLFMLLSPVSEHIAYADTPIDISRLMYLTRLLSGRVLPGGVSIDKFPELQEERESQRLRRRIRFYPEDAQASLNKNANSLAEQTDITSMLQGEEEIFELAKSDTGLEGEAVLNWARTPAPGLRVFSQASTRKAGESEVWGEVRVISRSSMPVVQEQHFFYVVSDGIINFAGLSGVNEGDFYADENPRAHYPQNMAEKMLNVAPDGATPRPCQMVVQTTLREAALPPELGVYLQQSNPGLEHSDFLCRAQCLLTYAWDGNEYVVSGKYCTGDDWWGAWPYSHERFEDISQTPAPEPGK